MTALLPHVNYAPCPHTGAQPPDARCLHGHNMCLLSRQTEPRWGKPMSTTNLETQCKEPALHMMSQQALTHADQYTAQLQTSAAHPHVQVGQSQATLHNQNAICSRWNICQSGCGRRGCFKAVSGLHVQWLVLQQQDQLLQALQNCLPQPLCTTTCRQQCDLFLLRQTECTRTLQQGHVQQQHFVGSSAWCKASQKSGL